MSLTDIDEKVLAAHRLSEADGCRLFACSDLPRLGALANLVRERLHPNRVVTYVIGRNVNYTNVCWVGCRFCNFHRRRGSAEAYVLSTEEIYRKLDELVAVGGTELLMQGGLNPDLKLEFFEELLAGIKARFPAVHIHSLSATEVLYLARLAKLTVEETLRRLQAAGLDSLPGAGAEILVEEVRQRLSPRKETADQWLEVHRTAHRLGMNTTATMMYGSVETPEQRVAHLLRVRAVQDEALARKGGGQFTAFIPWSFQPAGTALQREGAFTGDKASGFDYLRTVAASRLLLDNVTNLQASWVTQGAKLAQVSLAFGVNDFGSTMMEENVVSQAGARFAVSPEQIEQLLEAAGYVSRIRNTKYEILGTLEQVRDQLQDGARHGATEQDSFRH